MVTSYNNHCVAVSDGKSVMKLILFEEQGSDIKEGSTIILKNYGVSKYTGQVLPSRRNTALYTSIRPVLRTQELERQGHSILVPVSQVVSPKEINTEATGMYFIRKYAICIQVHIIPLNL